MPYFKTLLAAGAALVAVFTTTANAQQVVPQRSYFEMPYDGAMNNNHQIGDFCCTGQTATVVSTNGTPIGYMYAFNFTGGVNYSDNTSGYRAFGLKVSGISNGFQETSPRHQGEIWFSADEIAAGVRSKSMQVGALHYTAWLASAPLRGNRVRAGQIRMQVSVQVR